MIQRIRGLGPDLLDPSRRHRHLSDLSHLTDHSCTCLRSQTPAPSRRIHSVIPGKMRISMAWFWHCPQGREHGVLLNHTHTASTSLLFIIIITEHRGEGKHNPGLSRRFTRPEPCWLKLLTYNHRVLSQIFGESTPNIYMYELLKSRLRRARLQLCQQHRKFGAIFVSSNLALHESARSITCLALVCPSTPHSPASAPFPL